MDKRYHKKWKKEEDAHLTAKWRKSNYKTYKEFAKEYGPTVDRSPAAVENRLSLLSRQKYVHMKKKVDKQIVKDKTVLEIPFSKIADITVEKQDAEAILFNEEINNTQEEPVGIFVTINGGGISMNVIVKSVEFLNNQMVCQLKHV